METRDTAALLERIRSARAPLETAFAGLGAERMTERPAQGGWSIKDHLAHVTLWEELALGRVEGRTDREYELFGMDEATAEAADIDALNAAVYERNKDKPLEQVLSAFQATHARLLAAIERLPATDLERPFSADDPRQRTLRTTIAENTYEHYPEHTQAIQALAGQRP